ncbi:MAG: CheY-like chemotaxis protein [Paracoccaceae bacterium]|jgi:CheY-like chemotaxis protein
MTADRGAAFTLRLRTWPTAQTAPATSCTFAGVQGTRALIVDDDAVNRSVTAHMLGTMGLALSEASSGAQAIAAIRDAPPDLLLLDMKLQDMHGAEVLRFVAAQLDAPEILVLSGEDGAEALTLPMGARAALTKPLDAALLRALRSAIACGSDPRLRRRAKTDAVDAPQTVDQHHMIIGDPDAPCRVGQHHGLSQPAALRDDSAELTAHRAVHHRKAVAHHFAEIARVHEPLPDLRRGVGEGFLKIVAAEGVELQLNRCARAGGVDHAALCRVDRWASPGRDRREGPQRHRAKRRYDRVHDASLPDGLIG